MWNRLALKTKITILTAVILTVMCACLTTISVLNSDVFYEPIAYVAGKKPIDNDMPVSNSAHNAVENVESVDEIYLGSRDKFKTQSIVSAIVIILLGTGLTYYIAGHTLKPLNSLADKLEEIDENNLNIQIVPTLNGGEVARLTASFNHMLEKLDKAFHAKKLFASNAAHELKTPLANILTNIEVLQMDDNPDISEYEEVIGIIKENVERLTVLVQDLLRFNTEFDDELCEDVQTNKLFEKIISDLSVNINEKHITVTSNGNINIFGEKPLLERAFFNLIQNAVKYNKDNGVIKITAADNIITIEDSGIGIPEGSLPQIFDPFYCVDKSRSRRLGGSGLGLSIVKQIFDKHGIKITVSSELGKGTKIFIKIFET